MSSLFGPTMPGGLVAADHERLKREWFMRQNAQHYIPAHQHMTIPFQETKPVPFTERWGMDLIRGRMRADGNMGFEHTDLFINERRVLLFVVTKTSATVLEDDPALFPSDKLITELRLLKG